MKTVTLGSQGLECGAMGLGCMGMSTAYLKDGETVDKDEISAVFKRCSELGISMLNTCEFYGADRANERLIGESIAFSPTSFQISLKVGGVGDIDAGNLRMDSTPARIKESVDTALSLLGVPCIDLIVQARQDPNTPLEQVMQCFKELVEAGKVKYVGLSEVGPSLIRQAHAIHPLTCVEQEWSLWSRDIERSIIPVCLELGIGVLAYSPLGRGFLTGSITKESVSSLGAADFRRVVPRLQGEALDQNLLLVEHVKSVAEKKGCTPAQVSLRWLYRQAEALGVSMVAIPGTKRVKYLDSNAAALDVELTDEDMAELNAVFTEDAVAGDRYPVKALMFTDE